MVDFYTQTGEEFVVDEMDAFGAYFGHWGSGAVVPSKASTDVSTPETEAREVTVDTQPAADILQWVFVMTADGTKTITNAAVFSLITGGICIVIGDHAGLPLVINDKIEYTVQLEQT